MENTVKISKGLLHDGLKVMRDQYLSTYYYTCNIEDIIRAGNIHVNTMRFINGY
jgi:hypothetical protein